MLANLFIFGAALYCVIQGATLATRYAALIAESFKLSRYTIGFILVAVIGILPETFVALNAALEGIPSFGLGLLLGSNVADLTLIIAIVVFFAKRPIKVEGKILKNHALYPFFLMLPLILGFDGHFSRIEGLALILAGFIFYYLTLRHSSDEALTPVSDNKRPWNTFLLFVSMVILLVGAHFTVTSTSSLAEMWGINPLLIGMFIVAIGTTVPELFFSLKAVRAHDDSLAIGDILGTVLADATIVIGLLALISPFAFPQVIIHIAGVFMVASAFILFSFMRSGKAITGKEGFALLVLWIAFAVIQVIVNL
jgi:cation:H+ antiporter